MEDRKRRAKRTIAERLNEIDRSIARYEEKIGALRVRRDLVIATARDKADRLLEEAGLK